MTSTDVLATSVVSAWSPHTGESDGLPSLENGRRSILFFSFYSVLQSYYYDFGVSFP